MLHSKKLSLLTFWMLLLGTNAHAYPFQMDKHQIDFTGQFQVDAYLLNKINSSPKQLPYKQGFSVYNSSANFSLDFKNNWTGEIAIKYLPNDPNFYELIDSLTFTYQNPEQASSLSIGKLGLPFALSNVLGNAGSPFLENNMAVQAFGPPGGLGLALKTWSDESMVQLGLNQPTKNKQSGRSVYRTHHLAYGGRLAYSPLSEDQQIVHLGGSYYRYSLSSKKLNESYLTDESINTSPEAYLDKGKTFLSTETLSLKRAETYGLELAYAIGPTRLMSEVFQQRILQQAGQKTKFKGAYIEASQILTGEFHHYKIQDGGFQSISGKGINNALELGLRYSHLDLNGKNVSAGRANSYGLAMAWYLNENLKVSGNYIFLKKITPTTKEALKVLGVRLHCLW